MLFQKRASRISDLKLDETLVRELSGLATDRRGLAAGRHWWYPYQERNTSPAYKDFAEAEPFD